RLQAPPTDRTPVRVELDGRGRARGWPGQLATTAVAKLAGSGSADSVSSVNSLTGFGLKARVRVLRCLRAARVPGPWRFVNGVKDLMKRAFTAIVAKPTRPHLCFRNKERGLAKGTVSSQSYGKI